MVVILGTVAGVGYWFWPASSQKPTSHAELLLGSENQLQKNLQIMVTKKAEKRSLQTQLSVYEKLLKQIPDNKELQQRVEVLRQRLKDLE